ncbi:MAG TPA: BTAD domain-containing putative transcriptional regulator [Jatrophihabitans sp.]|nr:BTAD domain-containing putative transcriptional regulator [Jatrophihabitans sp.]
MGDVRGATIRFEVLGPLTAWRDGANVDLGPAQQRVVLALLLLHANQHVGRQQIINAVWGTAPPTHAVNLVQRHMSGLRRVLEPGRPARSSSDRLTWTEGGYLCTVPPDELDLIRFDEHVSTARAARAAGDLPRASSELHAALRMWRGPVCQGLFSPDLDAQRERLAERHISTLEDRIELDIELGEDSEVIPELRALVADQPLRERLRGLLMSALYRSGRQAEALAAYQDARRYLLEEVGVAPAAPLQRLQQRILAADPTLARAPVPAPRVRVTRARPAAAAPAGTLAPAQLPHGLAAFVGRQAELARLDAVLDDPVATLAVCTPIVAVTGMPGVGKSALVLHWAHRVSERFPDGQLYLNLRGFDPAGPPLPPAEAVQLMLDTFGVPAERQPIGLEGRSALLRSLLAGRRMLMVLDNARDAEQLRPLLPGAPGCLVIAVSRNQLAGLTAGDGAHPLPVEPLPTAAARELLEHRLGRQRVAAEPAAADQIIAYCARLPLALSVVAVRAARGFPLSELAEDLRSPRTRLAALDGGDRLTSLRAAFDWSYRLLSEPAARLFRLLALPPEENLSIGVIASLANSDNRAIRDLLGELVNTHLVTERLAGCYAVHPLLRAFAAELSDGIDSDDDRRAAWRRMRRHRNDAARLDPRVQGLGSAGEPADLLYHRSQHVHVWPLDGEV